MRVVFTIKKIFKSSFPLDMNAYTINSNHRYTQPGIPSLYFGDGEKTVYAELGIEINENKRKISSNILKQYIY